MRRRHAPAARFEAGAWVYVAAMHRPLAYVTYVPGWKDKNCDMDENECDYVIGDNDCIHDDHTCANAIFRTLYDLDHGPHRILQRLRGP